MSREKNKKTGRVVATVIACIILFVMIRALIIYFG